jgi:hypothetical protein
VSDLFEDALYGRIAAAPKARLGGVLVKEVLVKAMRKRPTT